MSLGSFVLFQHQIISSPFEKNFHQVSGVTVVINNQDAPFFFRSPSANRTWPEETAVGFPEQKIRFDYLFHPFRSSVGDDTVWEAVRFPSNSASRDSYDSQVGQSPLGWTHSGCSARNASCICRCSSA